MTAARPDLPRFDNSYARLPERFYVRQSPATVAAPHLIRLNRDLAEALGIDPDARDAQAWADIFAGNVLLPGTDPLAMAYAGHQFGGFVPQLGDGRALLLGEIVAGDGRRRDVQLKGAGRTPFSRGGDGRAALGPVLREYVVSEAMHALGVPTTRALAAVTTGETVYRETPLPGAVLTRVASSHIRVGTFQYFAARGDTEGVRTLADHVIARHYPDLSEADAPYLALLDAFADRQAALIARWLGVGFIHGVMNTDNVSVAGETIDFGPCAFLDEYDPATVFSSIDQTGRYAYERQPHIGQWNLARFAETLLPLMAEDQERAVALATDVVSAFSHRFEARWIEVMAGKLGIRQPCAADAALVRDLLGLMQRTGADFTLSFRRLAGIARPGCPVDRLDALLPPSDARDDWIARWRSRLAPEGSDSEISARLLEANPAYIPRNHRVEQMIDAAVNDNDFAPFERLLDVLAKPCEARSELSAYALPPEPHERVLQTFCGT